MTRIGATAALAAAAACLAIAAPALGARAGHPCPGQDDASAPAAKQERTMLCLVNRARRLRDLPSLHAVPALRRSTDRKSGDILRCDEFSHEACDREFTYWMTKFGYEGCREGENIAWGSGGLATPASVFEMWMHSPGHRRNILGPYRDTGIGLRVGRLEGYGGAHVWTQEFGSEDC
jgi:uncharacterized protein YkwD